MNDLPSSDSASKAQQAPDPMAQLLQQAGPRRAAPDAMREQVYLAVQQEWQLLLARKQQRQRWLAVAASVMVLSVAGWLALRQSNSNLPLTTPVLATVVETGQALHAGDALHTTQATRLRINGLEARAAAQSSLTVLDATHVELVAGALYLNSRNAAPLTINTAYGAITHLGTRYLVSVTERALNVGVREGVVAVTQAGKQLTVNASEQLTMNAQGEVARSSLTLDDAAWQWADALASAFELDNRTLADFLQWVTNETGYPVRYQSNALQQEAQQTVLHGARTSQPPLQALRTILATTDMKVSLQNGEIVIQR